MIKSNQVENLWKMHSLSFSFKLTDLKTFSAQFKIDSLEEKAIPDQHL